MALLDLNKLPVILAGPIVRRVTKERVALRVHATSRCR